MWNTSMDRMPDSKPHSIQLPQSLTESSLASSLLNFLPLCSCYGPFQSIILSAIWADSREVSKLCRLYQIAHTDLHASVWPIGG